MHGEIGSGLRRAGQHFAHRQIQLLEHPAIAVPCTLNQVHRCLQRIAAITKELGVLPMQRARQRTRDTLGDAAPGHSVPERQRLAVHDEDAGRERLVDRRQRYRRRLAEHLGHVFHGERPAEDGGHLDQVPGPRLDGGYLALDESLHALRDAFGRHGGARRGYQQQVLLAETVKQFPDEERIPPGPAGQR